MLHFYAKTKVSCRLDIRRRHTPSSKKRHRITATGRKGQNLSLSLPSDRCQRFTTSTDPEITKARAASCKVTADRTGPRFRSTRSDTEDTHPQDSLLRKPRLRQVREQAPSTNFTRMQQHITWQEHGKLTYWHMISPLSGSDGLLEESTLWLQRLPTSR